MLTGGSYDVDVPAMHIERHEWDIHALWPGTSGARVTKAVRVRTAPHPPGRRGRGHRSPAPPGGSTRRHDTGNSVRLDAIDLGFHGVAASAVVDTIPPHP